MWGNWCALCHLRHVLWENTLNGLTPGLLLAWLLRNFSVVTALPLGSHRFCDQIIYGRWDNIVLGKCNSQQQMMNFWKWRVIEAFCNHELPDKISECKLKNQLVTNGSWNLTTFRKLTIPRRAKLWLMFQRISIEPLILDNTGSRCWKACLDLNYLLLLHRGGSCRIQTPAWCLVTG